MDAFDAIHRRVSIRAFLPDPVPRTLIERLLDAAVRAPNHKLTEPWRFTVLTGAPRERLADARAAHRALKFTDPAGPEARAAAEKMRRETLGTPAYVFVQCAMSDDAVRREDDVASAWMATQNLLTAATAEGLGTYVRTGGILEHPEVARLGLTADGHRLLSLISLGYPAEAQPPRRRTPAAEKTTWADEATGARGVNPANLR